MAQFLGGNEKKNTPIDAANESAPNHRIGKNIKKELENSGAHIQQRKDQHSARGTKRTIFPQKGATAQGQGKLDSILTEEKSQLRKDLRHSLHRQGRGATIDGGRLLRLRAGGGGKGPGREARVAHAVGGEGRGGEEMERLRSRGSGGGVDGNGMERRSRGVSGAEGGGQPRV